MEKSSGYAEKGWVAMRRQKKVSPNKIWRNMRGRLSFLLFLLMTTMFALSGRIYFIKNVHGEEYETRAKAQKVSRLDVEIPPNRGSIVDRNNQALAISTTVYNVVMDPLVLANKQVKEKEREKTLSVLSQTLELEYDELKKYISVNPETNELYANTHWKVLKKQVDKDIAKQLEGLKGVFCQKDTKRRYPLETVASHVIGFIRGDTRWGLEQLYDGEMTGMKGRSFTTYDETGAAVVQELEAKNGNTVVTTLDYTIQQYAEESVAEAMADFQPETAATLVMNPNTGEVLAMASSPNFDTNHPEVPLELSDPTFEEIWNTMEESEQYNYLNEIWKNFNISSTFEPGSIFKPIVVAAALEENLITPKSTFYCSGKKFVVDTEIPCALRTGHNEESLEDVLANSCNVGMMDIAEKMGAEMFYKYQKDFGIGSKTGIDLPGEESASALMYSVERIRPVELATMSFGQSFNTTSLQSLNAFNAVINGGNLMKPYIVSRVVDEKGNLVKENKPEILRKVISKETSDIVRKDLEAVIDHGTGKKAKIEGFAIGGKTGTAQQGKREDGNYTVSYAAFFPVEDPQYAVLCVIHLPPNYVDGITSPAKMTKGLMEKIIRYKSIEPSNSLGEGKAIALTGEKVTAVDDYTGKSLEKAIPAILNAGFSYEVVGSGNEIVNQVPHGGTEVEAGSKFLLYVQKGEGETGTVPVPDVWGFGYEEAVTVLSDAGLQCVTEVPIQDGLVVGQTPYAGISVAEGSQVKLILKKNETAKTSKEKDEGEENEDEESEANKESEENKENKNSQ